MKVLLSSCGNPDFHQDPREPLPGVPVQQANVTDVTHASQVCRQYIHLHDLGSGNWNGGLITDRCGQEIGRVSYNGRVWPPGSWHEDMEMLFDPYKQPPSSPPRYHLLNYLGVHKKTLRRNFESNDRDREEDNQAAELLYRPGQLYTVQELKLLSKFLWTAHDDCVNADPDEYNVLQVHSARKKIRFGENVIEKIRKLEALEKCGMI